MNANEKNPRKITKERLRTLQESLDRFGEISCFVVNRRTGNLISGHQRRKILEADESRVTITTKHERPDGQGTTALGYIEHEGEKYAYREVDWDEGTELAAMVAANAHGGTWDKEMLRQLVSEISEEIDDLTITGLSQVEIDRMMRVGNPLQLTGGETQGTPEAEESEEVPTGKHVRMIQLFLTTANHGAVMGFVKKISEKHGLANTTDAVLKAIGLQFEKIGAHER